VVTSLIAIVLVLFIAVPWARVSEGVIPTSAGRDPATWPFDARSPWNHPIGSGAVFEPSRIPITGGYANIEFYGTPVYIAKPTDPLVKIYDRGPYYGDDWPKAGAVKGDFRGEIRIPLNAPPHWGADGILIVIDPEKAIAYEFYRVTYISPDGQHLGWHNGNWGYRSGELSTAKDAVVDLKGDGIRLYHMAGTDRTWISAHGGSLTGGVIRRGELKTGIPHAIRFVTRLNFLNRNSPLGYRYPTWPWNAHVWPASTSDNPTSYGAINNVYMGSLLAIPRSVSEDSLGLRTQEGQMVFRALQNYGGYIIDTGETGQAGRLVTQVDPQARGEIADVNLFNSDLGRIFRALQVVANSHDNGAKPPWGPGGGGRTRRPLAPPFAQQERR